MLWKSQGLCENYGVLTGHKGAVLDLDWSRDSQRIFSASSDMTIANWDLETGLRIRRHEGHEEIINSLKVGKRGQEILFSGSDDGTIGIWDPRQKQAVDYIQTDFPICSIAVSETGSELYSGGIDNDVKVWDLRQQHVLHTMQGHTDTITSLEVSPDSQFLLSYSHDSSVKMWDIRPFSPGDRRLKSFTGAPLGLEKNIIKASWSSKGDRIAAGSGDGTAVIWDVQTTKILYKLPGHRGTVNDVRFASGNQAISELDFLYANMMLTVNSRFRFV